MRSTPDMFTLGCGRESARSKTDLSIGGGGGGGGGGLLLGLNGQEVKWTSEENALSEKAEQTRCRVDNKQKSNVHYRGENDNILTPRQIWSFCYISILFLVFSAPFQIKEDLLRFYHCPFLHIF